MKKTFSQSLGDLVLCDVCNEDWTNKQDSGGFIFGSNAYCPKCAKKHLPNIKKYGEERYIKAKCPANMSFSDFVRAYRGKDAKIEVISFDSNKEFMDYMTGETNVS